MFPKDVLPNLRSDEQPLEIDITSFNPGDFQLVDIREESEVKEEPLQNFPFIHHPLSRFKTEDLDHDTTYLFFCRSGKRSLNLVIHLRRLGYKKVYSLRGGILKLNQK